MRIFRVRDEVHERVLQRPCRAHFSERVAEADEDYYRLETEEVVALKLELFGWIIESEAYTKDTNKPFGELIQHRGKTR